MPSVTFATSCWEKDWKKLLNTSFLEDKIKRNQFDFEKKILVINNVTRRSEVEERAKEAVDRGILTDYFFVEDCIDEILRFFELTREALGKGFYYSNHELTSIYLCQTEYLLFFTGDTKLDKEINWIPSALNEFKNKQEYKVANPVWNGKFNEAKEAALYELEDFYVGFGFSDQCFLVRTSDFKAPIYNERNPVSERFPKYGGELFEKRVDAWMRNHNYLRLTFKHGYYTHEDSFITRINRRLSHLQE